MLGPSQEYTPVRLDRPNDFFSKRKETKEALTAPGTKKNAKKEETCNQADKGSIYLHTPSL